MSLAIFPGKESKWKPIGTGTAIGNQKAKRARAPSRKACTPSRPGKRTGGARATPRNTSGPCDRTGRIRTGAIRDSRTAQLNTAGLSFFNLDWANRSAATLTCAMCGRIEWFLADPEEVDLRRHMGVLHEDVVDRIRGIREDDSLRQEMRAGFAMIMKRLDDHAIPGEAADRTFAATLGDHEKRITSLERTRS
jgi:hypothetical protein